MNVVEVVVFTQPHCAPCHEVERLLVAHGVSYSLRDVFSDPDALGELEREGYLTTPVTRVGAEWIAGFRRDALVGALRRHGLAGGGA